MIDQYDNILNNSWMDTELSGIYSEVTHIIDVYKAYVYRLHPIIVYMGCLAFVILF